MMPTAGLKTIIALSFVLAIGFLLVILSCALYKVYYPLLVVATYVLAPVPNWIATRCANPDDFVESTGNGVLDLGRFCTGFMVVMGIGKASFCSVYSSPATFYGARAHYAYTFTFDIYG
ncbi:vacuolar protein sorting 55-domain-containing protein [Annulohypoxylon moriforme]|nr:vacuolar protein sorting 55-domain-containing protein [Annulohypoxylon moriforme]